MKKIKPNSRVRPEHIKAIHDILDATTVFPMREDQGAVLNSALLAWLALLPSEYSAAARTLFIHTILTETMSKEEAESCYRGDGLNETLPPMSKNSPL